MSSDQLSAHETHEKIYKYNLLYRKSLDKHTFWLSKTHKIQFVQTFEKKEK